MKNLTLSSILLLIGGEALVVAAFMVFFPQWPLDILALNIVVASLVWFSLAFGMISPVTGDTRSVDSTLPGLGLRGAAVTIYMILAVAGIVVMNYDDHIRFSYQSMYQAAVFLLMLAGVFFAAYTSRRAEETEIGYEQKRLGVEAMREAVENAVRLAARNRVKGLVLDRLNALRAELRFVSPSGNSNAAGIEEHFCELIQSSYSLLGLPGSEDKAADILDRAEAELKARKSIRN